MHKVRFVSTVESAEQHIRLRFWSLKISYLFRRHAYLGVHGVENIFAVKVHKKSRLHLLGYSSNQESKKTSNTFFFHVFTLKDSLFGPCYMRTFFEQGLLFWYIFETPFVHHSFRIGCATFESVLENLSKTTVSSKVKKGSKPLFTVFFPRTNLTGSLSKKQHVRHQFWHFRKCVGNVRKSLKSSCFPKGKERSQNTF